MKDNLILGLMILLVLGVGYIAYNSNYLHQMGPNNTTYNNGENMMGNSHSMGIMGMMHSGNNNDCSSEDPLPNSGNSSCTLGGNSNISQEILRYGSGQEAITEKKQETVFLQPGDNYTIEITKIKKDIGGKQVEMLAYNGSVPGPIIKAKVGTKANITIVNKVADLETTLHSHGLRLSDMFDGVVKDMMGTQNPIKSGDSFTYQVSFPDVGVFWYHPHLREDIQQELGLYGNYIVLPSQENYYSPTNREGPMILDDIAVDNNGVKPFYKDFTNYVLMGRFGNTSFINGTSNYTFNMKSGEVVRAYLTNVANTRVFNFSIPGVKIKLIGSDMGKYEKTSFIESLIISPGERYIVDLYAPSSGNFNIQNITPEKTYTLGKVVVSEEKVTTDYSKDFKNGKENTDVISDIDRFRPYFDKIADKNVTLELGKVGRKGGIAENELGGMMSGGMGGMNMMGHGSSQEIEYEDTMPMMNQNSTSKTLEWKIIDTDTKKENMDINWQFKKGDIVKIKIENKKDGAHPMQHPFHLHGQRFLVVKRNGEAQTNLVWKDTVLVKTGESIEIIADMSNPGEWMAHCHISEHLFSGMMMHFSVKE